MNHPNMSEEFFIRYENNACDKTPQQELDEALAHMPNVKDNSSDEDND